MRKLMIILMAATTLTITACAATAPTHTAADANSAIMAAEHETKRAAAELFEWRDTGKIIKKAQEALKAGKFDEAVKLANKAKHQSSMALQQAQDQAKAGPRMN